LSKRKSLDDVRDVYLFACFTGLRYSDIEKLKPEHIQEFKDKKGKKISIIKLNQQKTKEYLEIALNEYALEIIKKHEGKYLNCLPVISNQKTNDHLKEIGELAKLTNQVSKVSFVGSKKVEELVPKHEMLTMHTARHTFATLSLQKGMSIEVLQKLLGHNKISNTQIYAKIVDEHKHAAMIDVWKKKR
jgi:site-specific recombinase XerD